MRKAILLSLVLVSLSMNGQEKLNLNKGFNLIELRKNNNVFSFFYEDANASISSEIRSFQFPNVNRVYDIIINGFDVGENHKTYVLTNKNTIVRFEFSEILGEVQLKIKHNNLLNNYVGSTAYLNRAQIVALFKEFI
jgi:hypothetical protein